MEAIGEIAALTVVSQRPHVKYVLLGLVLMSVEVLSLLLYMCMHDSLRQISFCSQTGQRMSHIALVLSLSCSPEGTGMGLNSRIATVLSKLQST